LNGAKQQTRRDEQLPAKRGERFFHRSDLMTEKLYTIGEMSDITGVNAITLRAWERRYSIFKPKRTAKKHRLFTEDDITRIKEILFWLEKGVSIGQVQSHLQHKKSTHNSLDEPDYSRYQQGAIEGANRFDQSIIGKYMDEMFSLYPLDVIAQDIYPKVLSALINHWKTSTTAFSEKQFFELYLKNKLATKFLEPSKAKNGKKLIITTMDAAFNEIELLFLAAALSLYGFNIILLSPEAKMKELEEIINQTTINGIVFSINSSHEHVQKMLEFANSISIPICIRTRTTITEKISAENISFLPTENYKALLEKINGVFGEKLV
jgi:DNA-binding transcriptional MerR regulator